MSVSKHLERLASSAGWYAKGWRKVVEADNAGKGSMRVKDPFSKFGETVSVFVLRGEMRKALDKRINVRGGMAAANDPIDIDLVRDANKVNDYKRARVRFYDLGSKIGKKRCGHLVADRSE